MSSPALMSLFVVAPLVWQPVALLQDPVVTPAAQDADAATDKDAKKEKWVPLFNGKDLDGWTPKFTGYELGENPRNTFRVKDGLLQVAYDEWPEFGRAFGHLFFEAPFSYYKIRVEYRFVGEQCKGGPGWAFRNSGVMLHCQDPESMTKDQEFPASIEAQMLGGNGKDVRHTGNLCTPGTNVEMKGEVEKRHCLNSTSKTYHGDQWVTLELEVRGNEVIKHWMDGEVVLEYQRPQLDERDKDAQRLLAAGADLQLTEGYISLQAESHPLEFRKVELLELEAPKKKADADAADVRKEGSGGR